MGDVVSLSSVRQARLAALTWQNAFRLQAAWVAYPVALLRFNLIFWRLHG